METLAGKIAKKRKKPPHQEADSVFEDHRGIPEMARESVDDEHVANPESLAAHEALAVALHKIANDYLPNEGDVEVKEELADPPAAPMPEGISDMAKMAIEENKKRRRYM